MCTAVNQPFVIFSSSSTCLASLLAPLPPPPSSSSPGFPETLPCSQPLPHLPPPPSLPLPTLCCPARPGWPWRGQGEPGGPGHKLPANWPEGLQTSLGKWPAHLRWNFSSTLGGKNNNERSRRISRIAHQAVGGEEINPVLKCGSESLHLAGFPQGRLPSRTPGRLALCPGQPRTAQQRAIRLLLFQELEPFTGRTALHSSWQAAPRPAPALRLALDLSVEAEQVRAQARPTCPEASRAASPARAAGACRGRSSSQGTLGTR